MILNNTVNDCKLIDLPIIRNRAGNITPINNLIDIPFAIQRVYYLYDVPGGAERGGHAHKTLKQLIIAASGSFEISISDGNSKKSFLPKSTLSRINNSTWNLAGIKKLFFRLYLFSFCF